MRGFWGHRVGPERDKEDNYKEVGRNLGGRLNMFIILIAVSFHGYTCRSKIVHVQLAVCQIESQQSC